MTTDFDDDAAYAAELMQEMQRLGARPYAEIGVPMFLVPEDLTAPPEAEDAPWRVSRLGAEMARAVAAVTAAKGALLAADIASIVEYLADRLFDDEPAESA